MTSVLKIEDYVSALDGIRWSRDEHDLVRVSHDSWPLQTKLARMDVHEYIPDVVVFPASPEQVARVLEVASREAIPVTARGLGSSVTGQPLPQRGGIVLDLSELFGPIDLDETNLTVSADAGWNGGELEDELRERGYTLGHSPQSLYRSTIGGWVATMASGQLSSLYGGIEHILATADVVLSDGSFVHVGSLPRAAVGPDLTKLFIGSEGTLGVVTRVTLKVHRLPELVLEEAFHLPSGTDGVALIRGLAQSGAAPALLRLYDQAEARHVLGDGTFDGWLLLIASEGDAEPTRASHAWHKTHVEGLGAVSLGDGPVVRWRAKRYDFSAVERILATTGGYAETIEVAHTWSRIGELYTALTGALGELVDTVYGHFSHVYPQGTSLYVIVSGQAATDEEAVDRLQRVWATAMQVALDEGAVLSHHHGAGLARAPYIRQALGTGSVVLDRVKAALDPSGILNPGKLGFAGGMT